jgi:enamine deaminase RidA (YjgF/YER057c/UK114 family)
MLGTQNDPSVAVPTAMAAKPTAMQIGGSRTLLAFVAAVAAATSRPRSPIFGGSVILANSMGMAVNLVRSTRLFPGAPYAYAAKAFRGVLIFTAGACPLDEQGQVVAPGDISAQMRQALQNLRIALEESGATIPDVVKTTVYVASSDRSDLVTAWDEVAGFFGDHDVPSTLLGVAVLGYRASSSRSRPSRLRRRT